MTVPGQATGESVGFSVAVPSAWFEVDLHPATRDQSIRALVEDRVRDLPELREHSAAIARLLRKQAREAWDSGATYCASMVEPTEDGPVTASLTVSRIGGPTPGRPERDALVQDVLGTLTTKQARTEDDTWTTVTTVEVTEVGTCARAYGVEDIELPEDAGWVRVVQMQTFVPLPASGAVLVVSCSSPVLPLAEALLDLFDALTGTLRLVELA